MPLQYGGLGIHDLEYLGWPLRIRWLWLDKTDSSHLGQDYLFKSLKNAQALFKVADSW